MRVDKSNKSEVTMITLKELKGFANIVGTDRDNELSIALFRAVNQVESIANVSLSEMTVKLIIDDDVNFQRLYFHPVTEIVSVKNIFTGEDESYTTDIDKTVIKFTNPVPVVIQYKTGVDLIKKLNLRQNILELAVAYFDGIDEIAPILLKISRELC